jgi:hypothetical protein
MYDQSAEFGLAVVSELVAAGLSYADGLLRRAADAANQYRDEYLTRLDGYFSYRTAEGKVWES